MGVVEISPSPPRALVRAFLQWIWAEPRRVHPWENQFGPGMRPSRGHVRVEARSGGPRILDITG